MKFLKLCGARFRSLLRKEQLHREMNDEMRFHLEMQCVGRCDSRFNFGLSRRNHFIEASGIG